MRIQKTVDRDSYHWAFCTRNCSICEHLFGINSCVRISALTSRGTALGTGNPTTTYRNFRHQAHRILRFPLDNVFHSRILAAQIRGP